VSNPTRVMQLKTTLKAEFALMTVANGYNYDYTKIVAALPHPENIKDDLHLGFYVGKRQYQKQDDQRTVFNKDLNVAIQVVKHVAKKSDDENSEADDAQELIINDVERKISEWFTEYINDATNAWNVSFDKEPLCEYPMIIDGKDTTKVVVVFEFMIKLRKYTGISD
jgi:hypothetical protein